IRGSGGHGPSIRTKCHRCDIFKMPLERLSHQSMGANIVENQLFISCDRQQSIIRTESEAASFEWLPDPFAGGQVPRHYRSRVTAKGGRTGGKQFPTE